MSSTDFLKKLLTFFDNRTPSGGLLLSLYIDLFTEETSKMDLRQEMNEDVISLVLEKGYIYIPEKSDAKHLTFFDCNTIEVTYNDEIVVIGCRYINGEIESFTVEKKTRI